MVQLVAPCSAQPSPATPAGSPLAFSVLLMSPGGTQTDYGSRGTCIQQTSLKLNFGSESGS